jgi:hypothetical protein
MSTQPSSPSGPAAPRAPRRLVLLQQDEQSPVEKVLKEYANSEINGTVLHAELQRFAAEHPGRWVAGEWLGPRGWTRFLWCQK